MTTAELLYFRDNNPADKLTRKTTYNVICELTSITRYNKPTVYFNTHFEAITSKKYYSLLSHASQCNPTHEVIEDYLTVKGYISLFYCDDTLYKTRREYINSDDTRVIEIQTNFELMENK